VPDEPAVQVVSSDEGPRFLGLRLAERNRRIVHRATEHLSSRPGAPATLVVPPGAALTAAVGSHLPPGAAPAAAHVDRSSRASRVVHLVWRPDRPPLVWRGPGARDDDAPDDSAADTIVLPPGVVLDVSTPALRRRAAWRLLKASGKPGDGWLSRHVHRKVSRVFSYAFLQVGLSAKLATFLTLGVGLVAAWCFAQTSHETMIAGGALLWFASIADGIDGEMARVTLSESARGESLDTAVDQLTHMAGLTGVVVGWWRQGMGTGGLVLAAAVVVGVPFVLLWAMALVRRAQGTGRFFVATKPIELAVSRVARETGAPPLRAAAAVFVLFRREAFTFTLFLVSLASDHRVVYPALIAAGLLVVASTLALYGARLESALEDGSARNRDPEGSRLQPTRPT